jgi:hypothetical protein
MQCRLYPSGIHMTYSTKCLVFRENNNLDRSRIFALKQKGKKSDLEKMPKDPKM